MEYLEVRAKKHFRDASGEMNAILAGLQAQDANEAQQAPGAAVASVTPLFVDTTGNDRRGPLQTQSGYRGVYKYGKKWQAAIQEDGRRKRISVHDEPEDAALAYDEYVRAQSGGAAPVNFPQPGERAVTDPGGDVELDAQTLADIEGGPMRPRPQPGEATFEDPPPGLVRIPREPDEDEP